MRKLGKKTKRTNPKLLQIYVTAEDVVNIRKCASSIHPTLRIGPFLRDIIRNAIAQRMAPDQSKAA